LGRFFFFAPKSIREHRARAPGAGPPPSRTKFPAPRATNCGGTGKARPGPLLSKTQKSLEESGSKPANFAWYRLKNHLVRAPPFGPHNKQPRKLNIPRKKKKPAGFCPVGKNCGEESRTQSGKEGGDENLTGGGSRHQEGHEYPKDPEITLWPGRALPRFSIQVIHADRFPPGKRNCHR